MINQLSKITNKTGWPWDSETSSKVYSKNSNWPKISIVTPSYNQGEFIEETIRSILLQNYPNLEYIIIDGGSTDNTVEIIKKYEEKLTYWISEPDRGQAHAINKGLEKCTGEVFNWINSDDYLEPGSLYEIGKHFVENKQTHVLCGYTHCYFQETGKTSHTYRMGIKDSVSKSIIKVQMNQPGSFYKMFIINKLNGVNESLTYVFDDELWFRYLCKYGMEHLFFSDELFVHFRLHGNSKSVSIGYDSFYKELTAIHYNIAKQLKLPDFLLLKIKEDTLSSEYITSHWDFKNINRDEFEAWYCHKYLYSFYNNYEYKETIYCLKKAKKYGFIKPVNKAIVLWVKLIILNTKLLNSLRKVKWIKTSGKKPIIYHLKNVSITSEGVVIKNFDYFKPSLIDLNYFPYKKLGYLLSVYLRKKKVSTDSNEKYLLVHDFWYMGYFHWLADTLPRIWAIREFTKDYILILPSNINKYHLESIKHFSFKGILYLKIWQKCKVLNLTMPSHIVPSGYFNSNTMLKLSDFYRQKYANSQFDFKYLYISRKKANYRKVVNEKELETLLEQKGYRIIYAEDYSFEEQVMIFCSCQYLISTHGAGLTNMLFMPKNSFILELRMKVNEPNDTFARLSSSLGHNFKALNCLPEGNPDFQKGNIIVDLKEIENLL